MESQALAAARAAALAKLEDLRDEAKAVAKVLEDLHSKHHLQTMDFYSAKILAESSWRAADFAAQVFDN